MTDDKTYLISFEAPSFLGKSRWYVSVDAVDAESARAQFIRDHPADYEILDCIEQKPA